MIQTLFGSTEKKPGLFDRMKDAVARTRENLSERIDEVVPFNKEIDRNTLDELEGTLLGADLGSATTHQVLEKLRERADRKQIKDVEELKRLLKEELLSILNAANTPPVERPEGVPEVVLVVGVNGTGKTTTIGKLAQTVRSQGKTALLCAADTFRAAAIEQLEIWGERTGTEVIRTKTGGDPAAVLYDALEAANARHTDCLIVDTAGRLHTKTNLMSELEKMRRTAQRLIPGVPLSLHKRASAWLRPIPTLARFWWILTAKFSARASTPTMEGSMPKFWLWNRLARRRVAQLSTSISNLAVITVAPDPAQTH